MNSRSCGCDACQVFLTAGPFFRRIKTINVEKFMRPVRKQPPGSKTRFPCWQDAALLKDRTRSVAILLPPASALNVETRSYHLTMLPFASRSGTFRWNIQRYSPFALRKRSFVFEDFSGREARSPLGNNPPQRLQGERQPSNPAGHFVQSDSQVLQPRFIEVVKVTVGAWQCESAPESSRQALAYPSSRIPAVETTCRASYTSPKPHRLSRLN